MRLTFTPLTPTLYGEDAKAVWKELQRPVDPAKVEKLRRQLQEATQGVVKAHTQHAGGERTMAYEYHAETTETFTCDNCGRQNVKRLTKSPIIASNTLGLPQGWLQIDHWTRTKYDENPFPPPYRRMHHFCSTACATRFLGNADYMKGAE